MNSEIIVWFCSALVGAVFVFAGVSKLAIGAEWQVQARNLGVPRIVIPIVPWFEIAVGLGLIGRFISGVVNVAALLMLMFFTAIIVGQLLRGRRPPCACFGRRSTRPIGWSNVTRNITLIALILVVLFV
jgi:hypothetical protein